MQGMAQPPMEWSHQMQQQFVQQQFQLQQAQADALAAGETKKRRKRKPKPDPRCPKRPTPPFLLFCGAKRGALKAVEPDLKSAQIQSRLGAAWRMLKDEDKREYFQATALAKEDYDQAMIIYKRTCPPVMPDYAEEDTGKKRKRDPNHPKQPPSAFFLFCNVKRDEIKLQHPDLKSGPQIQGVLGEIWRGLSEVEQRPFKADYSQRKAIYDELMKSYVPPVLQLSRGGGKKEKDPNRPRRPPSAFFLFCTAKRNELKASRPDIKAGPQLQVMLGDLWRNTSEGDKAPWQQEYLRLKAIYAEQLKYYMPPKTVAEQQLLAQAAQQALTVAAQAPQGNGAQMMGHTHANAGAYQLGMTGMGAQQGYSAVQNQYGGMMQLQQERGGGGGGGGGGQTNAALGGMMGVQGGQGQGGMGGISLGGMGLVGMSAQAMPQQQVQQQNMMQAYGMTSAEQHQQLMWQQQMMQHQALQQPQYR